MVISRTRTKEMATLATVDQDKVVLRATIQYDMEFYPQDFENWDDWTTFVGNLQKKNHALEVFTDYILDEDPKDILGGIDLSNVKCFMVISCRAGKANVILIPDNSIVCVKYNRTSISLLDNEVCKSFSRSCLCCQHGFYPLMVMKK